MKKYMCFSLTIISLSLIWIGCSDSVSSGVNENTSWIFVANEGVLDMDNGSISMIDDFGKVYVSDTENDRIQVFDSSGKFLFKLRK